MTTLIILPFSVIKCEALENLDTNAIVQYKAMTFGSMAHRWCKEGFWFEKKVFVKPLICNEDGIWEDSLSNMSSCQSKD